jgi:hypothetical protein
MPFSLRILKLSLWPVLLAVLLTAGLRPASADERILGFTSDVVVHRDASLTVTETIKVRAERQSIKRGIIREFPTTYRDRFGGTVRVGFEVLEVRRDGRPDNFRVESTSGGKKIYIGKKEVFLRPGVYTYTIKYRTDRQGAKSCKPRRIPAPGGARARIGGRAGMPGGGWFSPPPGL